MKKMIRPPILLAIMMSAMPLLAVPLAQADDFGGEIDAIGDLIGDVEGLGLKQGQENSLTKKLDAAIKHLEKDRTRGACQRLNVFIHQVEAFINGGILTPFEAQKLIDSAKVISGDIVC